VRTIEAPENFTYSSHQGHGKVTNIDYDKYNQGPQNYIMEKEMYI